MPLPFSRTLLSRRAIASSVALAFFVVVPALTACSSKDSPACDDSRCAPGNKCLPLAGETKCRKTCSSNDDPATSCPAGYACVAPTDGNEPFCVAINGITPKPNGQFGFACNPTKGLQNPDCDGDQNFLCYGQSPSDGNAYCTRYDCTNDRDCGAGFYCATVNVHPDVTTAKRSQHQTQAVCIRRAYCSPCAADLDCPLLAGRKQHCVQDDSGAGICTPECTTSTNCNNEAHCVDVGLDSKICYPRAGVCVGDGSLCAPCRSDADCGDDGICTKGQYTTEHSCAKKSTSSCDGGKAQGSCPKSLTTPKVAVACLGGEINEVLPDYCHGVYDIGGQGADVGCWTPNH